MPHPTGAGQVGLGERIGKCETNSVAPKGGTPGDFNSAGGHLQAPGHTGHPASGDLTSLEVRPDTGDAGKRVACGVIAPASVTATSTTATAVPAPDGTTATTTPEQTSTSTAATTAVTTMPSTPVQSAVG